MINFMQRLIQKVNYCLNVQHYEHLDLKANVSLDTDIFVQQKFDYYVVFFADFITRLHARFQRTPCGTSTVVFNTPFNRSGLLFLEIQF